MHELMQSHDQGTHRCNRCLLSGMGPKHDPHHHLWTPTQQTAEKMQSNKCHHLQQSQNATLHWPDVQKRLFHQRADDKYEILTDSEKVWAETLTHFTDLYVLRKAYGNNRAANSGFESAAHIRENSFGHSIITTESNLTCDLYVESLE
jgi:hypothetical protein